MRPLAARMKNLDARRSSLATASFPMAPRGPPPPLVSAGSASWACARRASLPTSASSSPALNDRYRSRASAGAVLVPRLTTDTLDDPLMEKSDSASARDRTPAVPTLWFVVESCEAETRTVRGMLMLDLDTSDAEPVRCPRPRFLEGEGEEMPPPPPPVPAAAAPPGVPAPPLPVRRRRKDCMLLLPKKNESKPESKSGTKQFTVSVMSASFRCASNKNSNEIRARAMSSVARRHRQF